MKITYLRWRLPLVSTLIRLSVYLLCLSILLFVLYNIFISPQEVVKEPEHYDVAKIVKKASKTEGQKEGGPWKNTKVIPSVKPEKKLQLLATFMSHLGRKTFIIEPDILKSFINKSSSSSSSKCQHWCQSSDVITFGVFSSDFKNDILTNSIKEDFTVYRQDMKSSSKLRNTVLTNQHIPSHLFLYNKPTGLLLHLVVFFERGDNFLWSDKVVFESKPEWWTRLKLVFGETQSAYPSFHVEEKTVENINTRLPVNIPDFLRHLKHSQFIECNQERADLFHKKFAALTQPSKLDFNISVVGLNLLKQLSKALESIHVSYRLGSGTLLGWYRECGFVQYTTDLDVEIRETDYKNEIIPTLIKYGFTLYSQFGKIHDHFELAFLYEGLKVDIFILYDLDDHSYVSVVNTWNGQKWRVILPKSDDCSGELNGELCLVPCDTESYLITNYGKNWFTPAKYWHLEHNQTNMIRIGYWDKKDFDFVILTTDPLKTYFYMAYSMLFSFVCYVMYATN